MDCQMRDVINDLVLSDDRTSVKLTAMCDKIDKLESDIDKLDTKVDDVRQDLGAKIAHLQADIPVRVEHAINKAIVRLIKWVLVGLIGVGLLTPISKSIWPLLQQLLGLLP